MFDIRNSLIAMTAIFVFSSGLYASDSPTANLLVNAGFEDGLCKWNMPEGLMSIDTSVSHSGRASLKYSWDNASKRLVGFQQVAVKPGKRYLVSAWIKCQGIEGSKKGATFGLEWSGGGAYPVGLFGTEDWTNIKYYTTIVPDNVTNASFFVTQDWGAAGTAWIDDISVIEVDPTPIVKLDIKSNTVVGDKDSLPFDFTITDFASDAIGKDGAVSVSLCSPPWNRPIAKQTVDPKANTRVKFATGNLNEGIYKLTCEILNKKTNRLLAEPESITVSKQLPMQCLLTPHSRTLLPGATLSVQIHPNRNGNLTGVVINNTTKATIEILSQRLYAGKNISILIPGKFTSGKYSIKLKLSATGYSEYNCILPFFVVDKKEVNEGVFVGKDNLLLDHGKPWFPMFVYAHTSWSPTLYKEMEKRDQKTTIEILNHLAGTPFGLLDYATPIGGIDDTVTLADECAKRGIRLALSVKDLYPNSDFYKIRADAFPGKTPEQMVRQLVRRLRNHPALALYYINDELSTQYYSNLKDMRKWVHEEDPLHPTLQVHFDLECVSELAQSYDIFAPELYPWPENNLRRMAEWSDNVTSKLPATAPFWGCLWQFKNDPAGSQKLRALAYLSIARGARGLLMYAYHELKLDPNFEKRWSDFVALGKEINSQLPILLQPKSKVQCKADSPGVIMRTVSGSQGTWLLAVNADDSKVDTIITTQANKQIKISMEPFEVKLIDLKDRS